MTLDISLLLGIGIPLMGLAVHWGITRNQIDGLREENKSQWEAITKFRNWRDEHEKDSSNYRIGIEKTFGSIRESNASREGKLDEIIRRLDVIEKKLEERHER